MNSGVYIITNILNGKRYIGSATNFGNRWRLHKNQCKKKCHYNPHFQRAWYKYGENAFKFEVLEQVSKNLLLIAEQRWLDKLKPEYNINKNAGSFLGQKHTAEAKRKMSIAARKRNRPCPTNFTMLGRRHSEETKRKMSLSAKRRVSLSKRNKYK